MPQTPPRKNILLIGASRGLGYAMTAEYMKHGWNVVGIAPRSTLPTRSCCQSRRHETANQALEHDHL